MRRSRLKLYAPFLCLALAQAAFVLVAPSQGDRSNTALDALGGDFSDGGEALDPLTGEPLEDGTGAAGDPGAVGTGGTGADPAGDGGSDGGSGGTDGGADGGQASGDTSHCKDGRQTDVIFNSPPCAPKFTGDNGGASYRGVTGDEILIIDFQCVPNEQVNALLAQQGLAATEAESQAMEEALAKFINERYELYGRKIVFKRVTGDCPLTPPDPAKSRQAAAEVVKMNPFLVIHYAGGPDTHDVWARNGIISLGGPHELVDFYNGRRPFRWDVFMDGSQTADAIAEYYCKKMAGGTATHAGQVIHASMPQGRQTPRKLGVIVPDNGTGTTVPTAKRVEALVEACSKTDVVVYTYASDINRATEQSRATVAGLIQNKVTTVVCMCDPIAPVFLTQTMTQNGYQPEHLLPGMGLLDFDKLGRLYDPVQWRHAFGPSHLVNAIPHAASDATKIWRAAGNSGEPCGSCNLVTGYWLLAGSMIQMGGPTLNPLTVERALVGARYTSGGGGPGQYLVKFGPNDYTSISDFREVYWDATARSAIDDNAGAYVPLEGGRRYQVGQVPAGLKVPVR